MNVHLNAENAQLRRSHKHVCISCLSFFDEDTIDCNEFCVITMCSFSLERRILTCERCNQGLARQLKVVDVETFSLRISFAAKVHNIIFKAESINIRLE